MVIYLFTFLMNYWLYKYTEHILLIFFSALVDILQLYISKYECIFHPNGSLQIFSDFKQFNLELLKHHIPLIQKL